MFRSLAIVLFLCCASSLSLARDVQMHGANGDGGSGDTCPDQATAHAAAKRPVQPSHAKPKIPVTVHGDADDIGPRTPRWHSFLPGMFR